MQIKVENKNLFTDIKDFKYVINPITQKDYLGSGSFGMVKLAKHIQSNMLYAIKIIECTHESQLEIQAIQKEIKIHFKCQHPNIIKLYDVINQGNKLYMVMEWARNGNLYSYLKQKGKLSEMEACRYFYQSCLATQYLHESNISHRDLKPENILLDEQYNSKICDFGWASDNCSVSRQTFCGTFQYMAPEILSDIRYDQRVDIWCLGILLYELLHGYPPYNGKTLDEIKIQVFSKEINFKNSSISQSVQNLIKQILQEDPDNRPSINQILDNQWVQQHIIQQDEQSLENLQTINTVITASIDQESFFSNTLKCWTPQICIQQYQNKYIIHQEQEYKFIYYLLNTYAKGLNRMKISQTYQFQIIHNKIYKFYHRMRNYQMKKIVYLAKINSLYRINFNNSDKNHKNQQIYNQISNSQKKSHK